MKKLNLRAAAKLLVDQRSGLNPIKKLPGAMQPRNEVEGYALQRGVGELLSFYLGPLAGYKIGCTTPVMQKFLEIPNPCAGEVFRSTVVKNVAVVPRTGFVKVGIECEIAVVLACDLSDPDLVGDAEWLSRAVGGVMASLEIVDDRYEDYRTIGVPTLIADNFFDCGCVLGAPLQKWRNLDLRSLRGTTKINGRLVGEGQGDLIMGDPLNALTWLAKSLLSRGQYIRKGQFVTLGSVVETKWLNAGDVAEVEIERLGSVGLRVV